MSARVTSRRPTAPSLVLGIVVAASFIVVETLAVLVLKQLDPQEAFETLYLLGVVAVSTVWSLGLATTTSVVSAIALAYFRNWPARHFVPLDLENGVVIVVFLVVAAIFKSLLGTSLAFLLLQSFKGKKLVRALVVIPFTLPISVSVLSWKWMYDSQFSVINWGLHKAGLIGAYGSESWPVWLGQPVSVPEPVGQPVSGWLVWLTRQSRLTCLNPNCQTGRWLPAPRGARWIPLRSRPGLSS